MPSKSKRSFSLDFIFSLPLAEKILFARHLAMMIKAGMTEVESLLVIRNQIKSRVFGRILDQVIAAVQNGQFLAEALSPFERAFGILFISLIRLGEVSGTLGTNLNYLADELQKSKRLRSKVKSAMIYPVIILVAATGLIVLMAFFVMPRIIPIFTNAKIPLPLPTKILLVTMSFFNTQYPYIILGVLLLAVFWVFALRIPRLRYGAHYSLLYIPIVRNIVIGYNVSTIARTSGLLLQSGLRIVEVMNLTAGVLGNDVYKKALLDMADDLRKGGTLHHYLEAHPKLFPDTVSRMIEVGEKTGSLNSNLLYLGEFYEGEVDESVKNLSGAMEPILILFMGILVGFVALAIISPIYSITQTRIQ